jgi:hypothetical protein
MRSRRRLRWLWRDHRCSCSCWRICQPSCWRWWRYWWPCFLGMHSCADGAQEWAASAARAKPSRPRGEWRKSGVTALSPHVRLLGTAWTRWLRIPLALLSNEEMPRRALAGVLERPQNRRDEQHIPSMRAGCGTDPHPRLMSNGSSSRIRVVNCVGLWTSTPLRSEAGRGSTCATLRQFSTMQRGNFAHLRIGSRRHPWERPAAASVRTARWGNGA